MASEIVLGYDGSAGAKAALPHAVALAAAFKVPLVAVFAYGVNPVGGVVGDVERETEKVGQASLDEATAAAKALDASVTVVQVLAAAAPVEALSKLSEERGARMLVIGGNGHTAMVGTLLGSVGYKLLHHTVTPVLVVHPT